jgi:hypothetical protein
MLLLADIQPNPDTGLFRCGHLRPFLRCLT